MCTVMKSKDKIQIYLCMKTELMKRIKAALSMDWSSSKAISWVGLDHTTPILPTEK